MGSSRRNVRLLNGIPIDEQGNPLPADEQRAYFAERPQPRPVESELSSPWADGDAVGGESPWGSGSDEGEKPADAAYGSAEPTWPAGQQPGAGRWADGGSTWGQANGGAEGAGEWRGRPQAPYGGAGGSGAGPDAPPFSSDAVRAKRKGRAAVICGVLSILFASTVGVGLVLGIVALVLAASAAKDARIGTAVAGRVLGIIGIVISALTLLAAVAVGAFSFSSFDKVLPSDEPDYVDDYAYYDEQEQTVRALAEARLDQLSAMSDEQLAALGAELDEDLLGFTGSYSYTDIGVDPVEVARWLSAPITYEIESVYAFPEDGDASVYATVVSPDYYTLLSTYGDKANAFLSSDEAAALDSDEGFARLGEIMRECLASPYEPSESYLSIEFLKNGDAWVIDEDDWRYEMEYLFWLF